jgi:hypothetical protein
METKTGKLNRICKYDNKNQNMISKDEKMRFIYEYNRLIIHNLYDHVNEYTYYEVLIALFGEVILKET